MKREMIRRINKKNNLNIRKQKKMVCIKFRLIEKFYLAYREKKKRKTFNVKIVYFGNFLSAIKSHLISNFFAIKIVRFFFFYKHILRMRKFLLFRRFVFFYFLVILCYYLHVEIIRRSWQKKYEKKKKETNVIKLK